MKDLPVEILRLILAYLEQDATSKDSDLLSKATKSQCENTSNAKKDLFSCCLVSRTFLEEVQPLLHHYVRISVQAEALRWLPDAFGRQDLAHHIRTLQVNCLQAETTIMQLLSITVNLRCLILEASNVETRDCLAECINTALARHKPLEQISLLGLTSIKMMSMVYNLPYRLKELCIVGLYKYKGALWDNCMDFINTESLNFTNLKVADAWDFFFLFQLCDVHPARPPTSLTFQQCQISFDFLPEPTYKSVREIRIFNAPKLLELDHLSHFNNLRDLTISTTHDFIKLSIPLQCIKRIALPDGDEVLAKLFNRWIGKDYFPSLEGIHLPVSQSSADTNGVRLQELRSLCRDRQISSVAE